VPSGNPIYIDREELLEFHTRVIARYGGMPGVRDRGALESCLTQPKMAVFGQERFPTLAEKAAAYCFFIVRNHPFIDGNKRTGFLAALHFLLTNGVIPTFAEDDTYRAISAVANGELDVDGLARVFRHALAD
jgi:death-on-curing protein